MTPINLTATTPTHLSSGVAATTTLRRAGGTDQVCRDHVSPECCSGRIGNGAEPGRSSVRTVGVAMDDAVPLVVDHEHPRFRSSITTSDAARPTPSRSGCVHFAAGGEYG